MEKKKRNESEARMDIHEEYAELKLARMMAETIPGNRRVLECLDNVLASMREGHGLDVDDDEEV